MFTCQLLVDIPNGFLFQCSFLEFSQEHRYNTYTYGWKGGRGAGRTFRLSLFSIFIFYLLPCIHIQYMLQLPSRCCLHAFCHLVSNAADRRKRNNGPIESKHKSLRKRRISLLRLQSAARYHSKESRHAYHFVLAPVWLTTSSSHHPFSLYIYPLAIEISFVVCNIRM